jgi:hypothetical protein
VCKFFEIERLLIGGVPQFADRRFSVIRRELRAIERAQLWHSWPAMKVSDASLDEPLELLVGANEIVNMLSNQAVSRPRGRKVLHELGNQFDALRYAVECGFQLSRFTSGRGNAFNSSPASRASLL